MYHEKIENILSRYECLYHNSELCVKAYHRIHEFNLKMPKDLAMDSIRKHGLVLDYSNIEDGLKSIWFTLINDYSMCEECIAVVEYALPVKDERVIKSIKGFMVRFQEQIPKEWMINLRLVKD